MRRRAPATTTTQLRRLRLRITMLISLLALGVVAVFAFVVLRVDTQLRDEQLNADLLRNTNRVAQALTFEDSELQPEDPSDLLGGDTAVILEPKWDVFAILDERELWREIPEASDEEIATYEQKLFFELDADTQNYLLQPFAEEFGGDREEQIQWLFDDPPQNLNSSAYRSYVQDAAWEAGLDLGLPDDVFLPADPWFQTAFYERAVELVREGQEGLFDVSVAEYNLVGRGVVVRDGTYERGAVVALADPASFENEHRKFRDRVLILAAMLVAGSGLAAWFVAGRTIRPAATALAQQERFLADASHEMRTPIAAIRATAEAGGADGGDAPARLTRIASLAAGASGLTDDLLTLARIDAERLPLQTEPTRLDLLVEMIVDGDESFAVQTDEVIVEADPGLLERAIVNLLTNARNHGGATPVTPAGVRVGPWGVFVIDQGPGVAPGEIDEIFDRFRSGTTSSGHGLGLPLARWIARAHGGDLTVSNNPGGGASFHLALSPRRG